MFKSRRHGVTQSTDISSSQDNPSFHYIGWPCGCWWQEPVSHFLQTCFYVSDVQMPSGLNWLPVITKPPPGRWEQKPWVGLRDTSSMILQVLWTWPQEAFWSPAIHPSFSHALPFLFPLPMCIFIPITWATHSFQNTFLCLMFPWALPSIKPGKLLLISQTPNHFSSSRKHSQTTPITCSSIVLQNSVHNSLISLRILIIILMAKH